MAIDVKKWMGRIKKAEDLLNERAEERKQAIKLYTGTFFGKPIDSTEGISEVNFLYEYVDVLVSAIYARNPYIFVRPTSAMWASFAETMEKAINYYIKELKFKKKIQSAIIDGVLQPPGWLGAGYTYISEKDTVKKQVEEEFPELKDIGKKEKVESEIGILDETAKVDDVFIEHISSWNVIFPDGYHNIRECPYLGIIQDTNLEDLHNNPIYNSNKLKITGNQSHNPQSTPRPFTMQSVVSKISPSQETDKESIKVRLYHIWDRRSMVRFTLVKNYYDAPVLEREWNYLSEGFPVFPLIFNEIPATNEKANAYPLSDVVPMFPQLKELSLLSSAILRHRKRSGTLLLGKKGNITETDIQRIQQGSDVDFVLLDDISEASVKGFTPPALPREFYAIREQLLEDLYRISGYRQLLGVASGVETATESDILRTGAILRQTKRVDAIEDMTRDVAIFLAGLLWQYKSRSQISEIIGEQATEEMWPTLPENLVEARKVIQKQLQFTIEAGSSRPPKDEAIERKQYLDGASVIKANFPNRIKDDAFLMQILKKMGLKDLENVVITHDEQEINAAQQENQLLLQNMKQIVSPNENHMLHLQVHSQVYQTPGLTPTDAMNEHVDMHAKFMEQNSPKVFPQKGDSKLPTQSNTPDITRQGVGNYADLIGASKVREQGAERGR